MKIGVVVLNFGEPEDATEEEVVPFLERIFLTNASLEGDVSPEAARRRSRELAERRAPGLIEEYRKIGASPLNRQATQQARAVEDELRSRGHDARTYPAMQFTDPLISAAVRAAREDDIEQLVGLPVYPLCGASTTIAALDAVEKEVGTLDWDVPFSAVTGWHRHPLYTSIRADGIRASVEADGLDLTQAGVKLVFSAHATPMKYIHEGVRYQAYAEESCRAIARELGVEDHVIGYQNHTNRGIEWTQPDVETVIREVDADVVVVVPVSFMHEQSETLAELDHDLREEAEEVGLRFHRVPVPHDDPRFAVVLADLVEPLLRASGETLPESGDLTWGRCRCRPTPGTYCLNAVSRPANSM